MFADHKEGAGARGGICAVDRGVESPPVQAPDAVIASVEGRFLEGNDVEVGGEDTVDEVTLCCVGLIEVMLPDAEGGEVGDDIYVSAWWTDCCVPATAG